MITRLDLGYIIRPAEEAGTVHPRTEPILGYVVRHPQGTILFDTGVGHTGTDDGRWVDNHYRPHRRDLREALHAAGVSPEEIGFVANCHLHFDHCGGNAMFASTPILTQRAELELALGGGHTLPELVDFPGARYEVLDGEWQVLPGVWVVPTPGHTAGHQSLVVRHGDGTLVLAGQAHDFASEFGSSAMAIRSGAAPYPAWLERILSFDPRRVLFAHDRCVWEPA